SARLAGGELVQGLENQRVVLFRLNLGEDPGNLALRVDDESSAEHAHVLLPVHGLLTPGAVFLGDLVVDVADQGEPEAVFVVELLDRLRLVRRHPDHLGAQLRVLVALVPHPASLRGAPRRIGPRVEVENDRFAFEGRQLHLVAVLIGQRERRRLVPWLEHGGDDIGTRRLGASYRFGARPSVTPTRAPVVSRRPLRTLWPTTTACPPCVRGLVTLPSAQWARVRAWTACTNGSPASRGTTQACERSTCSRVARSAAS